MSISVTVMLQQQDWCMVFGSARAVCSGWHEIKRKISREAINQSIFRAWAVTKKIIRLNQDHVTV